MKKSFLLLLMMLLGSLMVQAQRYMVNSDKGKIRVVQYELIDGKWVDAKPPKDIYIENGYEFEAVPPVSEKKIIMEYEGKYYHVIRPQKELKLVDEMGKEDFLGMKNKLRNSVAGKFYFSSTPALIGLLLTIVALIVFIIGVFEKKPPYFLRMIFVVCLFGIVLLEFGGYISLGSDAYWWCNPDDVGYLLAIPFTLLFGITVTIQFYSIKMYKIIGRLDGKTDVLVYIVCGIGMVIAAIAFMCVLFNFLFAACCVIFMFWFFGSVSRSTNKVIDHRGNTTYVDDLGARK